MTTNKNLSTDFVISQVLIEEKSRASGNQHVALFSNAKGKGSGPGSFGSNSNGGMSGGEKKSKIKCHHCKKRGHIKVECRKLKAELAEGKGKVFEKKKKSEEHSARVAMEKELDLDSQSTMVHLFMAQSKETERNESIKNKWIVDSGATAPMPSHCDWFITYKDFATPVPVGLGDDSTINAISSGSVRLTFYVEGQSPKTYEIRDVYYIPEL